MITKKNLHIPGVGDVLLENSNRAKYMNLSIRPFRGIRVAIPPGVSFETAEAFALSKAGWIQCRLPRLKELEKKLLERRQNLKDQDIVPDTAKALLLKRLDALSRLHNLPYRRVFIKRQKTRWGSCSGKKNINLNIALATLPEALIDYAILHELVHTKFLHHGPAFWKELERLMPGAVKLHEDLRRYDIPRSWG